MPRSINKEDAAPSDYYGWRCGEPVEEVRKTIAQQLQEYHSEKATKQRRKEELEERIRLGNRGDYGDSGDDDELTIARRDSMRSQVEWEERQYRRARTDQDSVFEIRGQNVDEETQGDDMDDISLAQSNEENVQLLTSSGGDGDDPGGNNEDAC
ncbi:hypothetical protein Gogos_021009 [Gossypium gossypioides]|uniref:Uncharacterized protein n=1 Tax=Gossypium gossypioides TaxID=34282 RepID=A0A7J9D6B0_GOSGO|nr:hypothetical protein [Gossypium gossypioides]